MRGLSVILMISFFSNQLMAEDVAPNATVKEAVSDVKGTIKDEGKVLDLKAVEEDESLVDMPPANQIPNKPSEPKGPEWYFGPSYALGIPHFQTISFDAVMPNGFISFGVNKAGSKVGDSLSSTEVGINALDATLRLHLFSGSFFVGASYGSQSIYAKKIEVISSQDISAKVTIDTTYLTPHAGWMWGIGEGGLMVATEFGLQIPTKSSSSFESNASTTIKSSSEYKDLASSVTDSAELLGKVTLPYFTLLKIGWLF